MTPEGGNHPPEDSYKPSPEERADHARRMGLAMQGWGGVRITTEEAVQESEVSEE